jgi:hypothetical protein
MTLALMLRAKAEGVPLPAAIAPGTDLHIKPATAALSTVPVPFRTLA